MNELLTRRIPARWVIVAAMFFLSAALVSSVMLGPMKITALDSIKALWPFQADLPDYTAMIIQEIRLPRTLLAIAVGAILAMCGAVMQGLFRNPLADPGIIGVSAGASLGAAIAIVLFGHLITNPLLLQFGTVPLFAFIGGALTTFAIYALGTGRSGTSVTIMLLAGVAIGAIAGAGLGLLNYFANDQALRDLSLWTMGSVAGASWKGIALAFSCLVLLGVMFYRLAHPLNALLLGEAEARHLGINVQRLKRQLILLTAAGVGVSVALAGMIGFIGLVVPHIGRMLTGPDHRTLLPISALLGGLVLLISDMMARTLVAPLEIPVGIITAALGAPFFLALLVKQKGQFI